MKHRVQRFLERNERTLLYRSIIRVALGMPYRVGSERPYDFSHYDDVDQAVDIAVEMEEERPGCTK